VKGKVKVDLEYIICLLIHLIVSAFSKPGRLFGKCVCSSSRRTFNSSNGKLKHSC